MEEVSECTAFVREVLEPDVQAFLEAAHLIPREWSERMQESPNVEVLCSCSIHHQARRGEPVSGVEQEQQHWVPLASYQRHLVNCHEIPYKYAREMAKQTTHSRVLPATSENPILRELQRLYDWTHGHSMAQHVEPVKTEVAKGKEDEKENDARKNEDGDDEPTTLLLVDTSPAPLDLFSTPSNISDFYAWVRSWKQIPQAFQSVDMANIEKKSLQGWLIAEMDQLFPDTELDMDVVDFIIGLLNHPEFCQPDMLMAELEEILGEKTRNLILGLWKFLVVEQALQARFKDSGETRKSVEEKYVESVRKHREEEAVHSRAQSLLSLSMNGATQDTSLANSTSERDYKRRRKSYRAKHTSKTKRNPIQILRDLITKQMDEVSYRTHRILVKEEDLSDEGVAIQSRSQHSTRMQQVQSSLLQLLECVDPLQVRDLDRKERSQKSREEEYPVSMKYIRKENKRR